MWNINYRAHKGYNTIMQFEILKTDLAARIGKIYTDHGIVNTPAYVPVIHPAKQTIPAKYIKDMGFDIVITNAYITRNVYADKAIKRGIHNIIKYDGAIMTDSGGYQVLEYGKVKVTPPDMAAFERGIKTDFAIPLDKPTGFGMSADMAESYVKHTLKVSKETLANRDKHNMGQTWIGPIQGGEHSKLVAKSTKSLLKMGFQMLALGSPVEFMESYEYLLLAKMIITAKQNMPHNIPLHLFGAGHPLTIPLAVALGCDTFDSASYILYAKQRRYMTEDGTRRLNEIEYFPCCCIICSKYTPKQMQQMDDEELLTRELGIHNLYAIKLELDKTKQAIAEGRLWEYIIKKSRAHPKLYEAITKIITMPDVASAFKTGTLQFKHKAAFLYNSEDQHRPEVTAYHNMTRSFKTKKQIIVIIPESQIKPGYMSREYKDTYKKTKKNAENIQFCQYSPILGIIPIEVSDIYPAAHHEFAHIDIDPIKCTEFAKTWDVFFTNNNFAEIRYDKDDKFLNHFTKNLKGVKRRALYSKNTNYSNHTMRNDIHKF